MAFSMTPGRPSVGSARGRVGARPPAGPGAGGAPPAGGPRGAGGGGRALSGSAGGTEMLARELVAPRLAEDAGGQLDMFDAVGDFLEAAAAPAGLIVALEDLQWADGLSLALLRHLDGELHRTRLLAVATCRPTAAAGPLASLIGGSRPELGGLAGLSGGAVPLYG